MPIHQRSAKFPGSPDRHGRSFRNRWNPAVRQRSFRPTSLNLVYQQTRESRNSPVRSSGTSRQPAQVRNCNSRVRADNANFPVPFLSDHEKRTLSGRNESSGKHFRTPVRILGKEIRRKGQIERDRQVCHSFIAGSGFPESFSHFGRPKSTGKCLHRRRLPPPRHAT